MPEVAPVPPLPIFARAGKLEVVIDSCAHMDNPVLQSTASCDHTLVSQPDLTCCTNHQPDSVMQQGYR